MSVRPTVRTARLLALPLCASLGVLAATGVPSQAVTRGGSETSMTVGAAHAADAAAGARHVKKHKHSRIKNKRLGIPRPVGVSGNGVNEASVTWAPTKGANRYSVIWSPAPYGKWPGPVHYIGGRKWMSGSARSATLNVANLGAYQLSLPYGNPAFLDLMADNSRDKAPRHKAKYIAVWPKIATPAAGAPVRIATYNIDGVTQNVSGVAANIASSGAQVVAIQEAVASSGNNRYLGDRLAAQLGGGWRLVPAPDSSHPQESTILYNSPAVTCDSPSYPAGRQMSLCHTGGKQFYLTSVHFGGSNAQTGADAQAVANAMPNNGIPAIIAGDFESNREPYGSADQAQPTLVRAGFWDAQASLSKYGAEYSTFNGHTNISANPSGQGTRADYIMMRGINGSLAYHNSVNAGGNPSDHNLVWADIQVP